MRVTLKWLTLLGQVISYGLTIDVFVRAIWAWAKLGSFGAHAPAILCVAVVAANLGFFALRPASQVRWFALLITFMPTLLILASRHY
jgi:hypothetical protein